jgi:hypothetical protein
MLEEQPSGADAEAHADAAAESGTDAVDADVA